MSVDRTIDELSGTLAQLGQLVGHINGQIGGITARINGTLDNFDRTITSLASDASSVTGQVGDTVSQVPNAWVFYLLFITLIVVFILLSIVLILNLITKIHAIYGIMRGNKGDGSERSLIMAEERAVYDPHHDPHHSSPPSSKPAALPLPEYRSAMAGRDRDHVAISMDAEPRRPGRRDAGYDGGAESRAYQRRGDDAGIYNLESGVAAPYPPPRNLAASDF